LDHKSIQIWQQAPHLTIFAKVLSLYMSHRGRRKGGIGSTAQKQVFTSWQQVQFSSE